MMLDAPQSFDHRETSATYSEVICLFERHRVISSRCEIQWIVQKAEKSPRGPTWRALRYFQTKPALLAFWGSLHQAYECESWHELDQLPEHFQSGGRLDP